MHNITDEEKKVIDELRRRTIKDATPKMLEDDTVFYRFAKARDFNLVEAEAMLKKHIAWRIEFQIDTILTDYVPPEVLPEYYASKLLCFDKEGSLVRFQDWGHIDAKGLCNAVSKAEMFKFCFYCLERDKTELMNRGGNFRKPIFSPIYDFDDLTYSQAVNMKSLQYLLYGVKLLIDNYPESIKIVTVINAPFYFAWIYNALKTILPSTITQKIRVYGTDGWKEVLLNEIDADQLPAFLGGNKTDPDGNPLCETFVQRGKPVPKRYWKHSVEKKLVLESNVEKLIVMPFSKKEITFAVKEDNSSIEWEIEIAKGDIDFSLQVMVNKSDNLERLELIPKQRIDATFELEKGCFKCEKIGNYAIVFDNSYSWFHSKEVYYRAVIKSPKNSDIHKLT